MIPCRCGHSKNSHMVNSSEMCAWAACYCKEYRPLPEAERKAYEAAMEQK